MPVWYIVSGKDGVLAWCSKSNFDRVLTYVKNVRLPVDLKLAIASNHKATVSCEVNHVLALYVLLIDTTGICSQSAKMRAIDNVHRL